MILGFIISFALTCKNYGKGEEESKVEPVEGRAPPIRKAD